MKHEDDHVIYDYGSPRTPFWVPVDKQMVLRCLRCGDKLVVVLPLPIAIATAIMRAYGVSHRRCPLRSAAAIRRQMERRRAYGLAHGALDWKDRA